MFLPSDDGGILDQLNASQWEATKTGMDGWRKTWWFKPVEWGAAVVAAFVTLPTLIAAQTATTTVYVFTAIAAIGGPIVAYGLLVLVQWAFVAPRRRLRYALGVLNEVNTHIALRSIPVVTSEFRHEGYRRADNYSLIRLKIDNHGTTDIPPGALFNIIYPASWDLWGCNELGLLQVGSSIRSDEDLPGDVPARLWMWQAPGPLVASFSTLLWFRVKAEPGSYRVVVRVPQAGLNQAHELTLTDGETQE
jgi:hypothetical protein